MTAGVSPCRTYIVYHHGLFAQGVRSVLETRRAVQIVGMESDVTKALKAVQSLKPEVIIVEESMGKHQRMRLGAFLNGSTGGRVVTLSLDHEYATVYDRHRVEANDPADLVRAIQGVASSAYPGAGSASSKGLDTFSTRTGSQWRRGPIREDTLAVISRSLAATTGARVPRSVNLIGLLRAGPDLAELKHLLSSIDVNVQSVFTAGATPDELSRAGDASLNLVTCETSGLEAAKILEQRFGIPYCVVDLPVGKPATDRFLDIVDILLGGSGRKEGS